MKWMAILPPPVRWSSVAAIRASNTGCTNPGRWATSTLRWRVQLSTAAATAQPSGPDRPVANQYPVESSVVVGS